MGKGTHVTKPILPDELKDLYQKSADRIGRGQEILPLTGGAGLRPQGLYGPGAEPPKKPFNQEGGAA